MINIGFVLAAIPEVPVAPFVGAGEPQGSAIYSKFVAELLFVKLSVVEFEVVAEKDNAVGRGQVGAGAHNMFATQPLETTLLSVVNTNVKQAPGADEVISPGEFVPLNVPINGAEVLFPS